MDFRFLISLLWAVGLLLHEIRLLSYFQQIEYKTRRYWKWQLPRVFTVLPFAFYLVNGIGITIALILSLLNPTQYTDQISAVISGIIIIGIFAYEIKQPVIKKIVYTKRVLRILLVLIILNTAAFYFLSKGITNTGYLAPILIPMLWGLLFFLAPIFIFTSNFILLPLESLIKYFFLRKAANKIKILQPTVIGITGSYGKTSTKNILAHIISDQKIALATPKSYNTLMGICKVINTSLEKKHEIFIVEMGAYRKGEIRKICKLATPHLVTITSIGPQHIERFGSIDNIIDAKYEIISSLHTGGTAIFNLDDAKTEIFIERIKNHPVKLVSSSSNPRADLYAKNISCSSKGLSFEIYNRADGRRYICTTRLLGMHTVVNILIALAIAVELGINLSHAIEKIKSLKPVPHRLELTKTPEGLNIIDDAYNSNPVGARNAIETLGHFVGGKKILVTPGLVELGESEEVENTKLGDFAANTCDLVVLIGEDKINRIQYIQQGLLNNGMDEKCIKIIPSINEAFEFLRGHAVPGDTILLLNDLPDIYSDN